MCGNLTIKGNSIPNHHEGVRWENGFICVGARVFKVSLMVSLAATLHEAHFQKVGFLLETPVIEGKPYCKTGGQEVIKIL